MSAEVVARDEVGELRAALLQGEWRALLAPGAEALLTMMLLDDAGWWSGSPDDHDMSAYELLHDAMRSGLDEGHDPDLRVDANLWLRERWNTPESFAATIAYTAACIDAHPSWLASSDLRRVFAILERFAPR